MLGDTGELCITLKSTTRKLVPKHLGGSLRDCIFLVTGLRCGMKMFHSWIWLVVLLQVTRITRITSRGRWSDWERRRWVRTRKRRSAPLSSNSPSSPKSCRLFSARWYFIYVHWLTGSYIFPVCLFLCLFVCLLNNPSDLWSLIYISHFSWDSWRILCCWWCCRA